MAAGAKVRAAERDEPLPFSRDADSLAAGQIWRVLPTRREILASRYRNDSR